MIAPRRESATLTLGQLSARLGISEHRVKYAITRFRIQPAGRVGIIRFWNESDVPRIKHAIDGVAARSGLMGARREDPSCPRA